MDDQNKSEKNDSSPITLEKASNIFDDMFFKLHPRKSWPEWFASHTDLTMIDTKEPNKLIFAIAAAKKKELDLDEWYEEILQRDVLAGFFPGTKDKCLTINHQHEILTIFSAEVDLLTSQINILTDLDMSLIDEKQLMKLRNVKPTFR